MPVSVTQTAAVNPKLGRIIETVFKGKSLGKRFVPKNVCTKTKFTAYCEESENYYVVSSVECILVCSKLAKMLFFLFRCQHKFWPI